jgi:chemotaxis protein CheD
VTSQPIFVGVAEAAVATGDAVLATVGLGSCVAILLHDAEAAVAGMAHVLLPAPHGGSGSPAAAKYANTAVPYLLREMEARGADRRRITGRIVGGASMFGTLRTPTMTRAGERNVVAAREALAAAGIRVTGEEVGSGHGRSVRLSAADGRVRVSSHRHPDVEL